MKRGVASAASLMRDKRSRYPPVAIISSHPYPSSPPEVALSVPSLLKNKNICSMIVASPVVRVVRQRMRSVWTGRRFLPMADLGMGAAFCLFVDELRLCGGRADPMGARKRTVGVEDRDDDEQRGDTSETSAVTGTARIGFAPIVRVDAPRREIELCATSETVDSHGTIFDYDASKDAFTRWIGNVRE